MSSRRSPCPARAHTREGSSAARRSWSSATRFTNVACGRKINVKSVAVASGLTPSERLAREDPDYLFDDLGDTERVAEAILA